MPSKNAIVFIDGSNLYHNYKFFFSKPGDIDLLKLSKFVAENYDLELVRVQYYNSIPDIRDGEAMYYRHLQFLSDLGKQGIKVKTRKLQTTSVQEIRDQREILIDSLDLCKECKPLVKKTFLDILGTVQKKEKGIDILIAIDMIKMCMIDGECDCCILLSGDADFIPAMEIIKASGKEVLTACVPKGYSRELRMGKFRYLVIRRDDILQECMKPFSN